MALYFSGRLRTISQCVALFFTSSTGSPLDSAPFFFSVSVDCSSIRAKETFDCREDCSRSTCRGSGSDQLLNGLHVLFLRILLIHLSERRPRRPFRSTDEIGQTGFRRGTNSDRGLFVESVQLQLRLVIHLHGRRFQTRLRRLKVHRRRRLIAMEERRDRRSTK